MEASKFLNPVKVRICYDEILQLITNKDFEEAVVSEGLDFANFLNFIFTSYPSITKKYPPGVLAMKLNGRAPMTYDILKDGDTLELFIL